MNIRVAPAVFAVVLLSFLLPWFAVSCQGQTVISATGVQILSSDYDSPMMQSLEGFDDVAAESDAEEMEDMFSGGGMLRGVAFVVLLCAIAGLALTMRGEAAQPRLVSALGGVSSVMLLLVLFLGPSSFRSSLAESGAGDTSSGDDLFGGLDSAMNEMMLNAVRLEFQSGFYIALVASLLVAGLGFYAWRGGTSLPTVSLSSSREPGGTEIKSSDSATPT